MEKQKLKNRITSIGLELEGGWLANPPGLKHDGSVQGLESPYRGEVCSTPFTTLEEADAWLRLLYPQETNNTCGFHVHVGLPALHYSRLMDENFNNLFLQAMEDFWSKYRGQAGFDLFRSRLDGQNIYCQKVFRPEQQLWRVEAYGARDSLPRYSQLNFCFGRHGTLECRLFPCFANVEHSIEGMHLFIDSINNFLASCKPSKALAFSFTTSDLGVSSTNDPVHVATTR